jgi:hypothetical protein
MELRILSFDEFNGLQKGRQKFSLRVMEKPIKFIFGRKVFKQVPLKITNTTHGWVGSEGKLHIKGVINVMTQLHEAFHYFMCEPERLKYDDFGLGWGSESFNLKPVQKILGHEAIEEEQSVCILTICAAIQLGIPKGVVLQEMDYANMFDESRSEYQENVGLIIERKLERFGFKLSYPDLDPLLEQ